MGRVVFYLHVEHSRETTQTLSTDAGPIGRIHNLQSLFLDAILRTARTQFVNINRCHQ